MRLVQLHHGVRQRKLQSDEPFLKDAVIVARVGFCVL